MDDTRPDRGLPSPAAAAELAARVSYGRLLALLASRSRDIAAAEDALSDAFAAALASWPRTGPPDNPEAWLLTAARRKLGHAERARKVREAAAPALALLADDVVSDTAEAFPDHRIKLMFVCSHPAIDPGIRTPLMLQTVLGLDAAAIAAAFLTAPAAMSQRLVRAKAKIRDAGLSFETPGPEALPGRIGDVMGAIYIAFSTGWDQAFDQARAGKGLSEEAIFLGRLAVHLLPDEPEAKGLLALMLYCEARRGARRDAAGAFVPLGRQDTTQWRRDLIIEAEALLTMASRQQRFGRYQCEAAIQSVHCQRALTGVTLWPALRQLYDLLASEVDSIGVAVSRAVVIAEAGDPAAAREALAGIEPGKVALYQPYWAARARIFELSGAPEEAGFALREAIRLTEEPATRAFLEAELTRILPSRP